MIASSGTDLRLLLYICVVALILVSALVLICTVEAGWIRFPPVVSFHVALEKDRLWFSSLEYCRWEYTALTNVRAERSSKLLLVSSLNNFRTDWHV